MENEETYKQPMREEIIRRLDVLPKAMKDSEDRILKKQDEIDMLDVRLKTIESRIKSTVINETEDGKAKYRNETERKIAIETQTTNDKEHQNMRNQIKKIADELNEIKIGFSFMDRKFKAARTIARLIGGDEIGR